MDLTNIQDCEVLYRVVRKSYPNAFCDGRPMAALFMDEKGVSVERDNNRKESEILSTFERRFKNDYLNSVKITAGECRSIDTYPIPKPTNNKCHAEIHDSDTIIEIGLAKAMRLAKMCRVVL